MSEVATAGGLPGAGSVKRLTATGILRQFAPDYVARHARQAAPQVRSTLGKLSLCRTAALGGRMLECAACAHRYAVYNSCGDRHCPQCAGARRGGWLEATRPLLLPNVDYFQVVFTLPHELSALCLGNRRPLYKLLFTSAWQALREALTQECGFEPAALLVLHTWNQRLEHHPHVHALVPGGGPGLNGERWVRSRHPRHRRRRKPYLVDNQRLSQRFRQKFLAGLRRLQRQGELRVAQEDTPSASGGDPFAELLAKLQSQPWVVFIEAPPHPKASPEQVLKYLARYLTGGPISERRLVAQTGQQVTFLARSTEKRADGRRPQQVPVTLEGVEFTRRWALHILPKGFTKVRRYGGYSNRHCKSYLERCRQLLDVRSAGDDANANAQVNGQADPDSPAVRCPRCCGLLICIAAADRPPWWHVMSGPDRPHWYRDG